MYKTIILLLLTFTWASQTFAQSMPFDKPHHGIIKKEKLNDKMLSEVSIRKVPIKELSPKELSMELYNTDAFNTCAQNGGGLELKGFNEPQLPQQGKGVDLGLIRYVGEQIWKIIENSKPVLNIQSKSANVFPRGISCWEDLEQWQMPISEYFEVTYKNNFNMNVVKYRFRITFVPGGQFNGKGQYLTNVRVEPSEIVLKPFYDLNSEVEILNAFNTGTKEAPIAGVLVDLKWTISTMVQASHHNFQFFVSGDGQLKVY